MPTPSQPARILHLENSTDSNLGELVKIKTSATLGLLEMPLKAMASN